MKNIGISEIKCSFYHISKEEKWYAKGFIIMNRCTLNIFMKLYQYNWTHRDGLALMGIIKI